MIEPRKQLKPYPAMVDQAGAGDPWHAQMVAEGDLVYMVSRGAMLPAGQAWLMTPELAEEGA